MAQPGFPDISEHSLNQKIYQRCHQHKNHPNQNTLDINKVLHRASLGCNETLSDKILSQKLVILLPLINSLRRNTVMSFLIKHMEEDENLLTFIPAELQKHSRPSYRGIQIRFVAYKNNVNLYPVTTRKEYLKRRERTSIINITEKIFVTHRKLIRETQKETLSR